MFFQSKRLAEREEGLALFNDIIKDTSKTLIIHYSCESFVTSHGKTPRVTSICIRKLNTAQTKSYSIHLQAQFEGTDFSNISDEDYDRLEKNMLADFFGYVSSHMSHRWVHWNMRDSNYGFEAINNRYKILGGVPVDIDEDRKYDLPRIISKIYSNTYEKNKPKGRLLNLAERNNITTNGALTGADEAAAFDGKEYLKLHISTLRKVDIIDSIIHNLEFKELRTNARIKEIYGLTPDGIKDIIKSNWFLEAFIFILGGVFWAAVEPLIQRLFGTSR